MANKKNRSVKKSLLSFPLFFLLIALVIISGLFIIFKPKSLQVAQITSTGNSNTYRVGVDYNSTSPDFEKDSFILNYHKPEVRTTVKSQLKNMADSGASYVNTRLWFTDANKRYPSSTWRLGFPPTQQELDNIKTYAQDVGATLRPNGQPLDLYITLLWIGCGDYISGHQDFCQYTWENYREKAKGVITQIFSTIGNQKRPDGQNLVHTIYMDGEVDLINKKNTDKWLTEVYPHFISLSNQYQINPSIYFLPDTTSSDLKLVNNNRVHATLKFMSEKQLFIPSRIDLSLYLQKINGNYAPSLTKIISDLMSTYPGKTIGVAETGYPKDAQDRKLFGSAFTDSYQKTGNPVEVAFWTTPNTPELLAFAAYPFDIASYLLPNTPTQTPPPGNTTYFVDVPSTYLHYSSIEQLRSKGIMNGCGTNPNRFCPDSTVSRSQAAYLLLRSAKGTSYTPPSPAKPKFVDVASNHPFYAWIDAFTTEGITSGCGNGNYCPDQAITRAQLAVFLLRSKYGSSYAPPAATSSFSDVPSTHPFATWIESMKKLGITSGCGNNKFCPDQPVTRGEFATFITRTFAL